MKIVSKTVNKTKSKVKNKAKNLASEATEKAKSQAKQQISKLILSNPWSAALLGWLLWKPSRYLGLFSLGFLSVIIASLLLPIDIASNGSNSFEFVGDAKIHNLETIPPGYLEIYERAADKYDIPISLLISWGETTTDHGRRSPYDCVARIDNSSNLAKSTHLMNSPDISQFVKNTINMSTAFLDDADPFGAGGLKPTEYGWGTSPYSIFGDTTARIYIEEGNKDLWVEVPTDLKAWKIAAPSITGEEGAETIDGDDLKKIDNFLAANPNIALDCGTWNGNIRDDGWLYGWCYSSQGLPPLSADPPIAPLNFFEDSRWEGDKLRNFGYLPVMPNVDGTDETENELTSKGLCNNVSKMIFHDEFTATSSPCGPMLLVPSKLKQHRVNCRQLQSPELSVEIVALEIAYAYARYRLDPRAIGMLSAVNPIVHPEFGRGENGTSLLAGGENSPALFTLYHGDVLRRVIAKISDERFVKINCPVDGSFPLRLVTDRTVLLDKSWRGIVTVFEGYTRPLRIGEANISWVSRDPTTPPSTPALAGVGSGLKIKETWSARLACHLNENGVYPHEDYRQAGSASLGFASGRQAATLWAKEASAIGWVWNPYGHHFFLESEFYSGSYYPIPKTTDKFPEWSGEVVSRTSVSGDFPLVEETEEEKALKGKVIARLQNGEAINPEDENFNPQAGRSYLSGKFYDLHFDKDAGEKFFIPDRTIFFDQSVREVASRINWLGSAGFTEYERGACIPKPPGFWNIRATNSENSKYCKVAEMCHVSPNLSAEEDFSVKTTSEPIFEEVEADEEAEEGEEEEEAERVQTGIIYTHITKWRVSGKFEIPSKNNNCPLHLNTSSDSTPTQTYNFSRTGKQCDSSIRLCAIFSGPLKANFIRFGDIEDDDTSRLGSQLLIPSARCSFNKEKEVWECAVRIADDISLVERIEGSPDAPHSRQKETENQLKGGRLSFDNAAVPFSFRGKQLSGDNENNFYMGYSYKPASGTVIKGDSGCGDPTYSEEGNPNTIKGEIGGECELTTRAGFGYFGSTNGWGRAPYCADEIRGAAETFPYRFMAEQQCESSDQKCVSPYSKNALQKGIIPLATVDKASTGNLINNSVEANCSFLDQLLAPRLSNPPVATPSPHNWLGWMQFGERAGQWFHNHASAASGCGIFSTFCATLLAQPRAIRMGNSSGVNERHFVWGMAGDIAYRARYLSGGFNQWDSSPASSRKNEPTGRYYAPPIVEKRHICNAYMLPFVYQPQGFTIEGKAHLDKKCPDNSGDLKCGGAEVFAGEFCERLPKLRDGLKKQAGKIDGHKTAPALAADCNSGETLADSFADCGKPHYSWASAGMAVRIDEDIEEERANGFFGYFRDNAWVFGFHNIHGSNGGNFWGGGGFYQ